MLGSVFLGSASEARWLKALSCSVAPKGYLSPGDRWSVGGKSQLWKASTLLSQESHHQGPRLYQRLTPVVEEYLPGTSGYPTRVPQFAGS